MDQIKLVVPDESYEHLALAYKAEHLALGETELHGGALLDQTDSYAQWLKLVRSNADPNSLLSDWVLSSTFFAVREGDGKIVGMVDIRHTLNDFLAEYGGHIGYGVRPGERGKGYATQILKLALDYAKTAGLKEVMLACYEENKASRRIIQKCGGRLSRRFLHTDGKTVEVYWIKL